MTQAATDCARSLFSGTLNSKVNAERTNYTIDDGRIRALHDLHTELRWQLTECFITKFKKSALQENLWFGSAF
jgi:hypothetical protein